MVYPPEATFTLAQYRADASIVFDAAEEYGRAAVLNDDGEAVIVIDCRGRIGDGD